MTDDVAECFKTLATEARKRKYQTLIDGVGGFFCYTKKQSGHGAQKPIHPLYGANWTNRFRVIWKDFLEQYPDTDIPKVTPHICRHTYCSHMAATGIPPKVLQTLMGHADISTTMEYMLMLIQTI